MSKYVIAMVKLPDDNEVLSKDVALSLHIKGGPLGMSHWLSVPAYEVDSADKVRQTIDSLEKATSGNDTDGKTQS